MSPRLVSYAVYPSDEAPEAQASVMRPSYGNADSYRSFSDSQRLLYHHLHDYAKIMLSDTATNAAPDDARLHSRLDR